jgi:hypothetical protein
MSGDTKRGGRGDRGKIAAGQEWEVKYMAQKYNVSADEVKRAVKAVGNEREKVEQYLQKKGRKS